MGGSAGLDAAKLLALVKTRGWLLVAGALVAATLAFVVSLGQSERYRATAVLLFGGAPRAESLVDEEGSADTGGNPEQATATNVALASLGTVAARVKRRLGTPATVDEIRGAVEIAPQGQSNLVDVTAESDTANGAAQLATTFAEEVVAVRRQMARDEIQRAIDALNETIAGDAGQAQSREEVAALRRRVSRLVVRKAAATGDVQLAERATPPGSASAPRPLSNAIAAGLVALVLGLGAMVLVARFGQRIRDEDELSALIAPRVLARIPAMTPSRRPVDVAKVDPTFLDAMQFLRLSVQRMKPRGEGLVLAVASPTAGDGKTMLVAWLAHSLALAEAEVVAVDCDLRSPMLRTYLNVGDDVDSVLPKLRVIGPDDEAALALSATDPAPLEGVFGELRDQADYVLVDTSPVASVAHASAVAAAADGVVLVVDLSRVRRKDLLVATEQLDNARAKVLGIVLNRATAEFDGYGIGGGSRFRTDLASNPWGFGTARQ